MTRSALHHWILRAIILLLVVALLAACSRGGTPAAGGAGTAAQTGVPGTGGTAPAPAATEEVLPPDIPIIEDTPIERASEGTLEYRVPMPLQDVLDYYQTELPAQGWEETGRPNILGTVATLRYSKEVEGKTRGLSVSMQYNENAQSTLVRLFWQGY
ncbi:MAG TPA: hypothetical protein VFL17_20825 [Anaerolineae bacterium]|nr:hypothetical protein [Anaerolineae bacterium]